MLCPRRLFTMLKDFLHAVPPALQPRHAEQEGKGRLLGASGDGWRGQAPPLAPWHPSWLGGGLVLRLSSWLAGCLAPYCLFGW